MKKIAFLLLSVLLCGGAFADESPDAVSVYARPRIQSYSQHELLKNWALSLCFAKIAKDDETRHDASHTAGAYLEFGILGLEAYEEIDALVKKYLAMKYGVKPPELGVKPVELNTMKCIDLFHSAELEALVGRLLAE
jgi:hypothetical protein